MATCLYKPKPCEKCGKTIAVGEECEYVAATKGVRHWDCNPRTGSGEQLAARLGFIHFDPATMAADGLLLRMRTRDRDGPDAAQRADDAPQREQGALFGMSQT